MSRKATHLSKAARDNRANQLNPNNDAHSSSRGQPTASRSGGAGLDEAARDNRANQLNPNNDAHRSSRGLPRKSGK